MELWNSGSLYQRDYESDYNAVRRFFVANPIIKNKNRIKAYTDNSTSYNSILRLIVKTQSSEYWNHEWLYQQEWGGGWIWNYFRFKQCPKCAEELFHCYAYTLDWCLYCPIHGLKLIECCPDCGKSWPKPHEILSRKCPTCGISRPSVREKRQAQLIPHTESQDQELSVLWNLNKMENTCSHVLYTDFMHDGLEYGVLRNDPRYPKFGISCFPEHQELFEKIGAKQEAFTRNYYKIQKISEKDDVHIHDHDDSDKSLFKKIILKTVDEAINQVDIDRSKIITNGPSLPFMDYIQDFSSVDISLSIWLSILSENKNNHFNKWYNRIFELLSTPVPTYPPEPYLIFSSEEKVFYEPDSSFKEWLFSMHLRKLLQYIYLNIDELQNILRKQNPTKALNKRENYLVQETRYEDFRVRVISNRKLEVLFDTPPSWKSIFDSNYLQGWPITIRKFRNSYLENSYRRYLLLNTSFNFIDCVQQEASRR